VTTVNGVRAYIAKPSVDYPKDKAILFLSDVFGLDLINNKVWYLFIKLNSRNATEIPLLISFSLTILPETASM
jgi:hypothetical protein